MTAATPLDGRVRIEIAWTSGYSTAEGDRVWSDVTTYVKGDQDLTIGYGRSDEQSVASPNSLALTLENNDGRYSPGNTGSPNYPNVKKGKPIRVTYREPGVAGNFLSANQASMETDVSDWSASGSVPPTLASSTTHADVGTKALRITWGTGGTNPAANVTTDDRIVAGGLTVGRTYTAQARVWVTAATPDVRLGVSGISNGTATSTKSAFAAISYTFVATAKTHALQVQPATAPTSGQQCWVDSVMVDEGSSVGTFTTTAPAVVHRFMGYVNEWPVVWPTGSDQSSSVTITAASRKARMGQTAPLTLSSIRAAYLATSPTAYWPMDEEYGTISQFPDKLLFRDVSNTVDNPNPRLREYITTWWDTAALQPVIHDGSQGPTDETSLVRFPEQAGFQSFAHYVGGGNVTTINSAGEMTAEVVARIPGDTGTQSAVFVFGVWTPDLNQGPEWVISSDGTGDPADTGGGPFINYYDPDTSTVVGSDIVDLYDASVFATATDGEIHHFALTLTGANTVKAYLDGVLIRTGVLDSPWTFNRPFTGVTVGELTEGTTMWAGHFAVHDRALTAAEILDHANAATAATETPSERVARIAGRVGVPSGEIDVETTIAADLGSQPEATRSAADIIDEVAVSTGGVLYDTRAGHLAMQARNHRYNLASAFSLSTSGQEVEADLTVTDDHRYTINTVEYTRAGTDNVPATATDQDSIGEYGVFNPGAFSVVSESDTEVESFAQNLLYRYADPDPRVSQVSVDLMDLSTAQRALVLAADVGTLFTVTGLPPQAPASSMALFVEGYTETINAAGYTMTINTTPGDLYQNVWIADSNDLMDSGIFVGY